MIWLGEIDPEANTARKALYAAKMGTSPFPR
jgi:hypothetical protein